MKSDNFDIYLSVSVVAFRRSQQRCAADDDDRDQHYPLTPEARFGKILGVYGGVGLTVRVGNSRLNTHEYYPFCVDVMPWSRALLITKNNIPVNARPLYMLTLCAAMQKCAPSLPPGVYRLLDGEMEVLFHHGIYETNLTNNLNCQGPSYAVQAYATFSAGSREEKGEGR